MFNQNLINILLKILAWVLIFSALLYFMSGFYLAKEETESIAEAMGYWLGYEVVGLSVIAFLYATLGVLHRLNNRLKTNEE